MRFALLGDHPDGLEMARALAASGRHEVAVYCGPPGVVAHFSDRGIQPRTVADLEEVLADPALEAVIVAGPAGVRADQLRRALQSERHVLCVYPADPTPDAAYEAALMQKDARVALVPLLAPGAHPAMRRLAELAWTARGDSSHSFFSLDLRRRAPESVPVEPTSRGPRPWFPGWEILRAVGGEIAEVSAFAESEEVRPDQPVFLAGRFDKGGTFLNTLLPRAQAVSWEFVLETDSIWAELSFPGGLAAPGRLRWHDRGGEPLSESWAAWDPWPQLVVVFEEAVARARPADAEGPSSAPPYPAWPDAIRGQELDDAARRAVERRRASTMEYPEATEEVGFKGTMTLVGCGLIWAMLLLLILSPWIPQLSYLIVVLLVAFLGLQILRWAIPPSDKNGAGEQ